MQRLPLAVLCLLSFSALWAERVPENVVIKEASDIFTFYKNALGIKIKTVEQTEYEATRHSDEVVPHVYYNNVITVDKVSGGKADYRAANSPNVFHDDSKICYFKAELKSKGSKAKSEFKRTFYDAAYFAKLQLSDIYPIRHKTVSFVLPADCRHIEFEGRNFPNGKIVRSEVENPDGSLTVTFEINDIPEISDDRSSPVALDREPFIIIKGYFKDMDELHDYHRKMLDVDTAIVNVAEVIKDATGGASDHKAVIDSLYKYVRTKIRYVAFEEGEAGYRPDKPAEVLRKQYGDCKGMALLLATLLNRAGIEANVAIVGTSNIPFRIADNPSLAATDHMICIVPSAKDTLFLDATYEYIASTDIPGSIQGKDAMMFRSSGYEMVDIPVLATDRSSEKLEGECEVVDGKLKVKARYAYKGDMLEGVLTSLNGIDRTYKDDVVRFILKNNKNLDIDKETVTHGYVNDGEYVISAEYTDEYAVTEVDDVLYVDLGSHADGVVERVDLTDRRNALALPSRSKIVRRWVLDVPSGYSVGTLPSDFSKECGGVKFDCRYRLNDSGCVVAEKTIEITEPVIERGKLEEWNRTVGQWMEASGQQVELHKQN